MAKLTAEQLRKIVQEEVGKFGKMKEPKDNKAKEYEPGEEADTLEKHVDMMKALKIEEGKLKKRLAQIQEQKAVLAKKLAQ